ncbi:unnamed protein product [Lactuca saligna]|uniref:Uncharacterized protein n=1 Tax=Lactuca saligna TaxID=75948 RepID=A0AA35ZDX4_LACSI|nr:unnamed protein product [Lactuca saligna]
MDTELTRTDIIKCVQSEKLRLRGVNPSSLDFSKLDVDAENRVFHNATLPTNIPGKRPSPVPVPVSVRAPFSDQNPQLAPSVWMNSLKATTLYDSLATTTSTVDVSASSFRSRKTARSAAVQLQFRQLHFR